MNHRLLHIAQLGAGYWGPNLIRNFIQLNIQLTVCDLDKARLKKMKSLYPNINITQNYEKILQDKNIDAIAIAIPAAMHFKFAKKALEAGKHVFVEKPLAMRTMEAEELCHLAKQQNKVLMVGHTFLYNAAVTKIKEYIVNRELGDIYYIMSQRLNLGRVRQDVNAMWNLAPHDISMILYWLGEEPATITANGLTFLQEGIEDVVFMNLNFASGRAAHIHVSWLDPNKTRKIVIVGSKKMIVYDDVSPDAKITIFDKGVDKKEIPRNLPDIENFGQFQIMHRVGDIHIPRIEFKEPLRIELSHFLECINNNSTPLTDGANGLATVKVLNTAQQQLDNKKK